LLQFRRRATQLGQLEDWFIFNGTYPSIELSANAQTQLEQEAKAAGLPYYRPDLPYLEALGPGEWAPMSGTPTPIASASQSQSLQIEGMLQRNPGTLGLIEGTRVALGEKKALEAEQALQHAQQALQHAQQARQDAQQARQRALQTQLALQQLQQAQPQAVQALRGLQAQQQALQAQQQVQQAQQQVQQAQQQVQQAQQRAQQARQARDEVLPRDNDGLMDAIVKAINSLEERGYVGPYVCVFGRRPFEAAHESIRNSTALPRDRIEPLIGRELLHASAIDVPPYKFELYDSRLDTEDWRSRGVLISMADEPIDLALAAEAAPEFRQVNLEGRYVFSVFERFTLRIKDVKAIVPLRFKKK
jgi:cell division septum initiation protein DivIVA